MRPDHVEWDEPDNPRGNVRHIAAADLTPVEVEEALDAPAGPAVLSRGAAGRDDRWIVFGWTTTGRHIAVVFEILCDDPYYVRPVTAFDAPEYGEGE